MKNGKLTDQACFVYRALFILTESVKNSVQKIIDRTIASNTQVTNQNI